MKIVETILNEVEVSSILLEEEMKFIEVALNLKSKGDSQLIKIRNEVVRYCSDKKLVARENGDWDMFDMYQNGMSKIITTIDVLQRG